MDIFYLHIFLLIHSILEHQNNKQKLHILKAQTYNLNLTELIFKPVLIYYILGTYNLNLTELIFKPVLIYLNVFCY